MIAALILAGGQGTRLGGTDKPLLRIRGTTLLHILLARLRPQATLIALSANGDPARFAPYNLPILPDAPGHAGPLAGVAAGLAWAAAHGATALLTVPGDTPFIPQNLAARLAPAPAWATSAGAVHPLAALWPTFQAAPLAAWLTAGGDLRVKSFGATIGMRPVDVADTPVPFFNINTPADLAAAQVWPASLSAP
jgi:molybdopterin-guanine dinucleotide biosynthesis protein A